MNLYQIWIELDRHHIATSVMPCGATLLLPIARGNWKLAPFSRLFMYIFRVKRQKTEVFGTHKVVQGTKMARPLRAAGPYAVVTLTCLACVSGELTMRVFRNSAMAPPASANLTVNSLEMTVPFSAANGEGSAEVTGVFA